MSVFYFAPDGAYGQLPCEDNDGAPPVGSLVVDATDWEQVDWDVIDWVPASQRVGTARILDAHYSGRMMTVQRGVGGE